MPLNLMGKPRLAPLRHLRCSVSVSVMVSVGKKAIGGSGQMSMSSSSFSEKAGGASGRDSPVLKTTRTSIGKSARRGERVSADLPRAAVSGLQPLEAVLEYFGVNRALRESRGSVIGQAGGVAQSEASRVHGFDQQRTIEQVGLYGDATTRGGFDSLVEARLTFRFGRLVHAPG